MDIYNSFKKKDYLQKKLREKKIETAQVHFLEMIFILYLKNIQKVKNLKIWIICKINILSYQFIPK